MHGSRYLVELAVVPEEDDDAVRLALDDVRTQLVLQSRPQQRRDSAHWRQPEVEDVVENLQT